MLKTPGGPLLSGGELNMARLLLQNCIHLLNNNHSDNVNVRKIQDNGFLPLLSHIYPFSPLPFPFLRSTTLLIHSLFRLAPLPATSWLTSTSITHLRAMQCLPTVELRPTIDHMTWVMTISTLGHVTGSYLSPAKENMKTKKRKKNLEHVSHLWTSRYSIPWLQTIDHVQLLACNLRTSLGELLMELHVHVSVCFTDLWLCKSSSNIFPDTQSSVLSLLPLTLTTLLTQSSLSLSVPCARVLRHSPMTPRTPSLPLYWDALVTEPD